MSASEPLRRHVFETNGERSWAGQAPPGAVYRFASDWKEKHVLDHLSGTGGILQADAYKSYAKLYVPDLDGESSSARRPVGSICDATFTTSGRLAIPRSPARRSTALANSTTSNGQPAETRSAIRQERTKPMVEAFRTWADAQLTRIPGKSDLAKAFRDGLSRWLAFTFIGLSRPHWGHGPSSLLEDGRVAIDSEPFRAIGPSDTGERSGARH